MDWFFTALAWLLPTRTVDGAIGFVQKAIDGLAAAEEAQAKKALRNREIGERHLRKANVATEQVLRASRVRRNLTSLIDGE